MLLPACAFEIFEEELEDLKASTVLNSKNFERSMRHAVILTIAKSGTVKYPRLHFVFGFLKIKIGSTYDDSHTKLVSALLLKMHACILHFGDMVSVPCSVAAIICGLTMGTATVASVRRSYGSPEITSCKK